MLLLTVEDSATLYEYELDINSIIFFFEYFQTNNEYWNKILSKKYQDISKKDYNEMKKFGYLNKDDNTNSENGKEKNKERLNAENQTVANPKKKGRGKKKKKFKKFAGNKGKSLEIKMNMETNEEEKNERGT